MSDALRSGQRASNNMACHFHRLAADVPQLHVSPMHTMVGIFYWGHGEDHIDHPLTGRSSRNPERPFLCYTVNDSEGSASTININYGNQ